jgi:hypothetical protein
MRGNCAGGALSRRTAGHREYFLLDQEREKSMKKQAKSVVAEGRPADGERSSAPLWHAFCPQGFGDGHSGRPWCSAAIRCGGDRRRILPLFLLESHDAVN